MVLTIFLLGLNPSGEPNLEHEYFLFLASIFGSGLWQPIPNPPDSKIIENPEENTWLKNQMTNKQAVPVEYTEKVPIEQFDFIVIDECHRSIYNLWKQVLTSSGLKTRV